MIKLPSVTSKDVIRALGKLGFEVARTRGSHHILKRPDGRQTVVPVHSGENIGPGLLTKNSAGLRCFQSGFRRLSLVFWIKRLIPGEGRQAFVNPEHNQEVARVPG